MKKYKIGYTTGVFDMFHIGHLNVIKNAKLFCDYLIVGVSTDDVVRKNKTPIIPYENRIEIVKAIRYVDKVVPQVNYEIEGKIVSAIENKIDVMFVGSDWEGTDKWNEIERRLGELGIDVVYLSHTDGISSTMLRELIKKRNK